MAEVSKRSEPISKSDSELSKRECPRALQFSKTYSTLQMKYITYTIAIFLTNSFTMPAKVAKIVEPAKNFHHFCFFHEKHGLRN